MKHDLQGGGGGGGGRGGGEGRQKVEMNTRQQVEVKVKSESEKTNTHLPHNDVTEINKNRVYVSVTNSFFLSWTFGPLFTHSL